MPNGLQEKLQATKEKIENRFGDSVNFNYNAFDPSKYVQRAGDSKKDMLKDYTDGKPRAITTDIRQVDESFKWKPGFLYGIGGWPQHGKSEYIKFLAVMKAVSSGWKSSFYSPESHPQKEFYETVARTYLGKSSIKYHSNAMTLKEYDSAIDWVHEHFYYIGDEYSRPLSPEEVREVNEYIHAKQPLNITVRDPWNKHKHNMNGRSIDTYLSDVLPEEQAFARKNNICNVLLIHPKTGEKLKKGDQQPIPGPDWWHGGQMWDNMMDVCAAVHRPNFHIDRKDEEVLFAVFKFKNQQTNDVRPGRVENIRFAFRESRYYFDGACPLVPVGLQPSFEEPKKEAFPVSDFDKPLQAGMVKEEEPPF